MDLTDWTWDDDYSRAYLPTSDPRVLAVIERDTDASAPDGDVYAPAAFFEYRSGWSHYAPFNGSTYQDDDALDVLARAMDEYGVNDERVERYMRAGDWVRPFAPGLDFDPDLQPELFQPGVTGVVTGWDDEYDTWLVVFYDEHGLPISNDGEGEPHLADPEWPLNPAHPYVWMMMDEELELLG